MGQGLSVLTPPQLIDWAVVTLLRWIWRLVVLACLLVLLGLLMTTFMPPVWAWLSAGALGVAILALIAVKQSRVRHLDRVADSAEVVEAVLDAATDGVIDVASAVVENID